MVRKRIKKQRLNECGSKDVAAGVLLILGVICIILAIVFQKLFMCVIGLIMIAFGMPLLLYLINYRVWWDLDGITVQNIFRKSRLYQYQDMSHYYVTVNQTVIVLKDGRKLHFRYSHTDLGEFGRLQNEMKKHLIGENEGESEKHKCPLYWNNCSRPIQLTVFLVLVGLVALGSGCIGLVLGLPVKESAVTYQTVKIVSVEADDEAEEFVLKDADGAIYYVFYSKSIEETDIRVGEEFKIGFDEVTRTVYSLQYRFKTDYVFDLEEYNAASRESNVGYMIFFGVFPILYLAFVVAVVLGYRFPERFTRLHVMLETMHFWSRRW